MFNFLKRLSALFCIVSLVTACATNLPPAPAQAASADYQYVIGPGDQLNVIVWRNPELSGPVPVRPDGRITTPLVEDMTAIGKNPTQLARDIEKILTKFIKDPVVSIVVTNVGSGSSEQIKVVGQAQKPASIPYRQNMTLLDVMVAVGGLTDFAAGNRAVLVRAGEGNKSYQLRLRDLVKKGDVTANIQVLPGDQIIIPESWF
jgi:polysaccharide biosynthesis/export protein